MTEQIEATVNNSRVIVSEEGIVFSGKLPILSDPVEELRAALNEINFLRNIREAQAAMITKLHDENLKFEAASQQISRCAEAIEFYMGGPWNCDGPSSTGKAFHIHECIRDIRQALQPKENKPAVELDPRD